MPLTLVSYWTAWNETNLDRVRRHLTRAVMEDVEWNDPRDSFVGIDKLEAAVRALRAIKPHYRFEIVSEIDHHHGRFRYRWDMVSRGRVLMEGLDIVTIDPSHELICRVDGFFGDPSPLKSQGSGVPESVARAEVPTSYPPPS